MVVFPASHSLVVPGCISGVWDECAPFFCWVVSFEHHLVRAKDNMMGIYLFL